MENEVFTSDIDIARFYYILWPSARYPHSLILGRINRCGRQFFCLRRRQIAILIDETLMRVKN